MQPATLVREAVIHMPLLHQVSNTALPAVFVFPYGGKSLSVARPKRQTDAEVA